jgi:hypothetical protein
MLNNIQSPTHTCWNCKYHNTEGNTLNTYCMWFEKYKHKKREIPKKVLQEGCKYHIYTYHQDSNVKRKFIDLFDIVEVYDER